VRKFFFIFLAIVALTGNAVGADNPAEYRLVETAGEPVRLRVEIPHSEPEVIPAQASAQQTETSDIRGLLTLVFAGIGASCGLFFVGCFLWTALRPERAYRCSEGHLTWGVALRFCGECGLPVVRNDPRCSQGHHIARGQNFCPKCGVPINN
jgi:hypothetical protein